MTENLGEFLVQLFLSSIPNIISGLKTIFMPNLPYFLVVLLICISAKLLFQTYTKKRRG